MNTLFFDLHHLSEAERLTIEVLADGLARRLTMQVFFKEPTPQSRRFLFLDANAANFIKCLNKTLLREDVAIIVLADAPLDLPPAVRVLLRPLRAKSFQELLFGSLSLELLAKPTPATQASIPVTPLGVNLLDRLGFLVAERGFAALSKPDCFVNILVHDGVLGLSAPLPADFFERRPKLSLEGWQEQPWPAKQVIDNFVDAGLLLTYLVLSNQHGLLSVIDPEQPMLLKKFPSFVFGLHFQTLWSSPSARNQLLRAALRMQVNSSDPEACTVTRLQQKDLPQQDVVNFFNILFLLGNLQKATLPKAISTAAPTTLSASPTASPTAAPKKRSLASRIRQHLGIES